MNNVIKLPANKFYKMLHSVTEVDFDKVVELLIFATDRDLPIEPIIELISQRPLALSPSSQKLGTFMAWCKTIDFEVKDTKETVAKVVESTDVDPRLESLLGFAKSIGSEVRAVNEHGRSHKYWFFRPGWEVESALWREHFGDDDPATVIAFYFSSFFKNEQRPDQRRSINLAPAQLFLLEWLIEAVALDVCRGKGTKGESLKHVIKGVIATACGLEQISEFALQWTSPKFMIGFAEVPICVLPQLLDYWGQRIDFASQMNDSLALQQEAIRQAAIISATLLRYINPSVDDSMKGVRRVPFLSDRTIYCLYDSIACIEIETNSNELSPFLRLLSVAIYDARDSVFGGVFPFSIYNAKNIIGELAHEDGRWLADFAHYDGENYDPEYDIYTLYVDGYEKVMPDGSIRTNHRAVRRYRAFRSALAQMEQEGLKELAGAWWAFFIASQARVFEGPGIPGRELCEIEKLTAPLLADSKSRSGKRLIPMNRL
jgi:hypothetical protein